MVTVSTTVCDAVSNPPLIVGDIVASVALNICDQVCSAVADPERDGERVDVFDFNNVVVMVERRDAE